MPMNEHLVLSRLPNSGGDCLNALGSGSSAMARYSETQCKRS